VTVRAGTSAVNGWTVRWTNPAGQALDQLWNGSYSVSGSLATVKPAAWNGSIPANGSLTFGFLATVTGTPALSGLTCGSP
jgi:hypothetical protein